MHGFREHRVRALCLLQTEMLLDAGAQSAVGVAEAAEEAGTRCTVRAAEKHAEAAAVELVLRSGGDGGHHLERIGQTRLPCWCEGVDLGRGKLELSPPVAKRLPNETQEEPVARLPARALIVRRPQLEARQEWCGLGGLAHVEADPDLLVERFHERHLAIVVPLGEGYAEAVQWVVAYAQRQLGDQLERTRDLIDDCTTERCPRRLREVELEQPGGFRFRRLIFEERLDPAVFRRRRTETLPVQLLERLPCDAKRSCRLRRFLVLGHSLDESRNRLGAGERRLNIGDEHLRVDQLVDELVRLVDRDLIADQCRRQLVRRRACACARQRRRELNGVVDGDQVVRAERSVEPGLGIPYSPAGAVEARVRPKGEPPRDARVSLECSHERGQVVHVEARVAPVATTLLELEATPLADLAEAAAGEQAEGSWSACGSFEVRDECRKPLPRMLAPPCVERLAELRGREIEGLAELRTLVRLAQATLDHLPVRPFRPGVELVERQQRGAQDEESGGGEVAAEAHGGALASSMTACKPSFTSVAATSTSRRRTRRGPHRRALPTFASAIPSPSLLPSLTHERARTQVSEASV